MGAGGRGQRGPGGRLGRVLADTRGHRPAAATSDVESGVGRPSPGDDTTADHGGSPALRTASLDRARRDSRASSGRPTARAATRHRPADDERAGPARNPDHRRPDGDDEAAT